MCPEVGNKVGDRVERNSLLGAAKEFDFVYFAEKESEE